MSLMEGLYKRERGDMVAHVNSGRPLIFYFTRPKQIGYQFTHRKSGARFVLIRHATLQEYLDNLPVRSNVAGVIMRLEWKKKRGNEVTFGEVMCD